MNTSSNYNLKNPPRSRRRARPAAARRVELEPEPAALARGESESELDQLKERLLGELLTHTADAVPHPQLRRAAQEAASLAWMTPFPLLVLPVLLEEKVEAAREQAARQRTILCRGGGALSQAA
jgi:hypothetical protein